MPLINSTRQSGFPPNLFGTTSQRLLRDISIHPTKTSIPGWSRQDRRGPDTGRVLPDASSWFVKGCPVRAAEETARNRVDRETVRDIVRLACRNDMAGGLALFREAKARGDLVFRGLSLRDMLLAQPSSPQRDQWVAALDESKPRQANAALARPAEQGERLRTVDRVRPSGTRASHAAAPLPQANPSRKSTTDNQNRSSDYNHLVHPLQSDRVMRNVPPRPTPSKAGPEASNTVSASVHPQQRRAELRAMLSDALLNNIRAGHMKQAHTLWEGLGRPMRLGTLSVLETLHRVLNATELERTHQGGDFLRFVAAVERQMSIVGCNTKRTLNAGNAVAIAGGGPLLLELSRLERGL